MKDAMVTISILMRESGFYCACHFEILDGGSSLRCYRHLLQILWTIPLKLDVPQHVQIGCCV